MRSIQVVNVRWYNATAWYGLELAAGLLEQGHETMAVVLPGSRPQQEADRLNVPWTAMDLNSAHPFHLGPALSRMERLVRGFRPDVVNCHRGEGFVLWALRGRMGRGFACVRTRGDQRPARNNSANRALYGRWSDAVIATSSGIEEQLVSGLGVLPQRVHRIYGGVEPRWFRTDPRGRERVRREFGFSDDHFVFGVLGRFDQVKGHAEFLNALSLLCREKDNPHLRALLIGFDTALRREQIEELAERSGVSERVRITGVRPDVAACIQALDAAVIPSLWSETIARAGMELMAGGIPLAASAVGVLPDLLSEEALFPPGDTHSMARLLGRMAEDTAFRAFLKTRQAETVSGLTRERFVERTLTVYEQALATRRG